MKASKRQIGGSHYLRMKVQPWDFMQACMTKEESRGFLKGCVIKYVSRRKAKNDILKAQHCIEKLVEVSK